MFSLYSKNENNTSEHMLLSSIFSSCGLVCYQHWTRLSSVANAHFWKLS